MGSGDVPVPGPKYANEPRRAATPELLFAWRFVIARRNSSMNPLDSRFRRFQFTSDHWFQPRVPTYLTSTAMSRVSDRWKLTVHVPAAAILMSGANAAMSSARFWRAAIGNVGVCGKLA